MNEFWEFILTIIFKSYKFTKAILYNILILPPRYCFWKILRWYHKNIYGTTRRFRELALGKVLTFIGILTLLFVMLKHTEFILYEPDAYDIPIYWGKYIKIWRKYALVHWLSFIWIYILAHLISWTNWKIHNHFKHYGLTMYYDLWFWYSMWYHGIFWTAVERYLNHGAGIIGLVYFTIFNHWLFVMSWTGEFMDDMEYDWDDIHEGYDDVANDTDGYFLGYYTDRTRELLKEKETTQLEDLTWDVFGTSMVDEHDDPDRVNTRFNTWELLMYPMVCKTDDEYLEEEFEAVIRDEPSSVWEIIADESQECDPVAREYWWEYWTIWHHDIFVPAIYPWWSPIKGFYLTSIRPLHVYPRRRIRAVGEYSRFNWRYKVFLMRFVDIPKYSGFGEYIPEKELWAITKSIYYICREIFLYWIRGLYYSRRDWRGIWFIKKYRKQLKKLRKWGSKNYSFFGKKNYKPKK